MELTIKEAFLFIGDLMERAYGWHINDRVLGIDIGEFEGKCEGLIRLLKAQEPKLMTLDLPPAEWHDKVIWLEIKGKEPTPCLFRECSDRFIQGKRLYAQKLWDKVALLVTKTGRGAEEGYTMEERTILIAVAWADLIVSHALRVGRCLLFVGIGVGIHYAIRWALRCRGRCKR